MRSFGDDARMWPVLLTLGAGLTLVGLAFWLSTRRDVGSALLRTRGGRPRASALLRSPLGLAWRDHRGAIIGWTIGSAVLMGTYGSLSQEILDAIADNPALGDAMGATPGAADQLLATVMSTFLMMLAMLAAAFAVMALGSLRSEEESGRLEAQLSGPESRTAWLGVHLAIAALGLLIVGAAGALSLAAATAASTGDDAWFGEILRGAVRYLPAALVFLALTAAAFGLMGKARGPAWALFGVAAVVAYLGPGFDLPTWVVRASPFQSDGADLISAGADRTAIGVLLGVTAVLVLAALVGFRRRDIPRL